MPFCDLISQVRKMSDPAADLKANNAYSMYRAIHTISAEI